MQLFLLLVLGLNLLPLLLPQPRKQQVLLEALEGHQPLHREYTGHTRDMHQDKKGLYEIENSFFNTSISKYKV